jgi:hypothetical protein
MRSEIPVMYTPVERAVLSKYFDLKDPRPRDLSGIDVSTPVDPDEWDEASQGIAPLPSDIYENYMLESAVARICLQGAQERLPQWFASGADGHVVQGRAISGRRPARRRTVRVRHLFTINWATSGPGFSWPEAYHVATLPGYNRCVVTGSADSPEAYGYCDIAVGSFRPGRTPESQVRACITSWWTTRQADGQERWEEFLKRGSIGKATATKLAAAVWPHDDDQR